MQSNDFIIYIIHARKAAIIPDTLIIFVIGLFRFKHLFFISVLETSMGTKVNAQSDIETGYVKSLYE
jgi:hypothetical protein